MRWAPLLAMLLMAPGAWAQEVVGVRVGNHPGHGRIVFDWRTAPDYWMQQGEDAVVLQFPAGAAINLDGARRPPRNILDVTAAGDAVRIGLRPGARARVFRVGPKLVVDAMDPVAERPVPSAQAAPPQRRGRAPEAVAAASPAVATPMPPPAAMPAPAPVPLAAPVALPQPGALPVRPLAQRGAILLPYPPTTGLAILRRGGQVLALFDSGEPLNLSALRDDPIFAALEAEALGGATLLRLPLASPGQLRARREATGWILQAVRPADDAEAAGRAIPVEAEDGAAPRLVLRARQPGRVVPVTDPESGLPLLLGTLREIGQVMPVARRLPELDLPQTMLGAAVLARADRVTMQATGSGFLIGAGTGSLALDLAAAEMPTAASMTRSFEFPRMAPAQMLERLRALQASIGAAPSLGRLPLRRAATEILLALGLPQEAQAMTELAKSEDPQAARDARLTALGGAAALLAGRLPQAVVLRQPELPDSDELNLWRMLLLAAEGQAGLAAPGLAASLPVLFDYAEALRSRLLPLAAQALAEAGATESLRQLLDQAGPLPELALPRAMLAEAGGDTAAALAGYDEIARGRDRLARARALRRAIELRLTTQQIDAGQAARALEATLFAWRGDAEEVVTRMRVAELRRGARDARGALALLRETEALFPGHAAALRPAIGAAFLAALEQEPPIGAVALFDAYPELLPHDAIGESAILQLADRLVALDLTERAALLLGQAALRNTGAARAGLGLRQAALRLAEGDAGAALSALHDSVVQPLPDALARDRTILAARAQARLGRMEEAVAGLDALGPAGAQALAELLADRQDWPAAAAALANYLRFALPAAPAPLDTAHRQLLLRQAAMLVLAGDEAGLAALRTDYAPRMTEEPWGAALALLTAEQLRGLADLPRLQREMSLFRTIPARLEALRAGGPVTR